MYEYIYNSRSFSYTIKIVSKRRTLNNGISWRENYLKTNFEKNYHNLDFTEMLFKKELNNEQKGENTDSLYHHKPVSFIN